MEHRAKLQPWCMARLQMRASIHSDFPELGTPVTMESSPGTTCKAAIFTYCCGVDVFLWELSGRVQISRSPCDSLFFLKRWILKRHGGASPCSICPHLSSQWTWHDQLCPHHHTGSRSHLGSLRTCTRWQKAAQKNVKAVKGTCQHTAS